MCKKENGSGLTLRKGAGITACITAIWCVVCAAAIVIFFHKMVVYAKLVDQSTAVKETDLTTESSMVTEDPEEEEKIRKERALIALGYYALGIMYILCLIMGSIAFISLIVGVVMQKSCPVLFWLIFMTLDLLITVLLALIHFFTDKQLELGVKLVAPIFAVIFVIPWLVVVSYYKQLKNL